ncbi:MAG: hypothetical protein SQA66_02675, partial [Candidatus Fervidibacter sacchari]
LHFERTLIPKLHPLQPLMREETLAFSSTFTFAKFDSEIMGGRGSCRAKTTANGDWRLVNGETTVNGE